MRPDPDERGFTLLEVLVAFVIASMGLALLTRAGLDGLRNATLAGRYQEATVRAQSHLAAVGDAPQPSDRQGDEGDGFHWRVRITPVGSATVAPVPSRTLSVGIPARSGPLPRMTLLAVSVVMSWGGELQRSVVLDSQLVVPGAAAGP